MGPYKLTTRPYKFNTCKHVNPLNGFLDCGDKIFVERKYLELCEKHYREETGDTIDTGDKELDRRIRYWQNELGVAKLG